jgi:predicted nucleotidyltransferase
LEVLMELDKDFNEFVELFLEHNVRFLIVGGYALAAHGLPRATGDLDAWVWVNPENAQNIMRALNAFGFQNLSLTESDFSKEDSIIQLGYPPFRIDILTSIDGVVFDQAWEKKIVVELNGMNVPFIGRDDLITNKKAAGRPQDIADVSRLTSDGK